MRHLTDWAELPFFLAIARAGSLRAAAEQLNSTHATVDRRLRALETAYSVRLFERSVAGLTLTEAGEALWPRAVAAEEAVLAARRGVEGLDRSPQGTVRLSMPMVMAYDLLSPKLAEFSEAHPDIDLQLRLTNRFEDLSRQETDVSLRVAYDVGDDVVGRRVLQYARGIYASQRYIDDVLLHAGPDGEGLTWIGWGDAEDTPDWVRASPFPKAKTRHRIGDGIMVSRLVAQGQGMSYLPLYAATLVDGLVRVPDTEVELDRSIWLLLHSDLRRTMRVRLLVDFLHKTLQEMRPTFLGPLA